jgi:hypothetical protein
MNYDDFMAATQQLKNPTAVNDALVIFSGAEPQSVVALL